MKDSLAPAMAVVFVMGIVAVAWVVGGAGPGIMAPRAGQPPVSAAPPTPPPPVEPVTLQDLTPEQAVTANAAVPFSSAPNPAARPFRLAAGDSGYERAVDCLASANYYEAGDDAEGQRAVAQVVINRLRHPAFPKTVCGVVYQGAERSTGCQFTFTCDGALVRVPSPEAWKRARQVAIAALSGRVYKPVGLATHYHTNWVLPYWSASLDKITAVGTHLFFRWSGWWGTPSAFRGGHSGSEPVILRIAFLSEAHRSAALAAGTVTPEGLLLSPEILALGNAAPDVTPGVIQRDDSFLLVIDRSTPPDNFLGTALSLCGTRKFCKVMGWTNPANRPSDFPLHAEHLQTRSFSYLRDRDKGFEKALWNCDEFARADTQQCMKVRVELRAVIRKVTPPTVVAAAAPVPAKAETTPISTIEGKSAEPTR